MDVISDTSRRQFVGIVSIIGPENLPSYVRQYGIPDEKTASAFDDAAFADRVNREYSLESPGATYLSAAYLAYNNKGNIPDSQAAYNIKRAAAVWGIADDVEKAVKIIHDHFEKLAAPREPQDSDYGLIVYDQAGTKKRKYPMFCGKDVEKAAAYFEENRGAYPANVRKFLTGRILQKAAEYGVPDEALPMCIFKEAGVCVPDRQAIVDELDNRAMTAQNPDIARLAENMAKIASFLPVPDLFRVMDKVASVIESCDLASGRVRYYGTKYAFPADNMYGMPYKQAEDQLKTIVVLGGNAFDTEKMAAEIDTGTLGNLLGSQFMASVSKEGTVNPIMLARGLNKLASSQKNELAAVLEQMFA